MAEKKQTNDPLEIEEALDTTEAFLIKNKNTFLIAVIALVVIVGGYIGYKNLIAEPREERASAAIAKGEQYFREDKFELALNGDSLGYTGFLKLADEFSGTDAANLSSAYAGICYAQLGQYENAVKFLSDFDGDDLLIAPAVLGTLGNCYANLNQLDKAAATLIKAANKAKSLALSPIYLIQAGEIYEKLGKNAEAVDAYKTVKSDYANTYQAMDIDKYIQRASIK